MINTKIIGNVGEKQAKDYIKKLGYKIIDCNYTTKFGEIDIIALDKKVIVFIEVKKRASDAFGRPSEAVTSHKQHKIRQVAEFYLVATNNVNSYVRFDVVEVLDNDINYIINAF